MAIEIEYVEYIEDWTDVDGSKELPLGEWLVKLDKNHFGTFYHVAVRKENVCFVGGLFDYDMGKVIEYRSIPN